MAQYNFYIEDELKAEVEKALADSGISGKPKFLEDMVKVYQIHLASKSNTEIDMSVYQNTNDQSKEAIQKAFAHILTTLDYNFSTLQQGKIHIEEEKQYLDNRTKVVETEVEKLKLKSHEEFKEQTSKHEIEKITLIEEKKKVLEESTKSKEVLEKSQKELESLTSVAKQTSSVMQENKELRADRTELQSIHSVELNRVNERYNIEIDKLKEFHTNLEEQHSIKMDSLRASNEKLQKSMNIKDKELFEVTHTFIRCKEDLEQYQEEQKRMVAKAEEQQKKLEEIASKYNKLLGKIEILEQLEKKHHNDMRKR